MATEGKRPWKTLCSAECTNWGAAGQDHVEFPNLIEETRQEKWDMIKAKGKCALGTQLVTPEQMIRELYIQELEHLTRILQTLIVKLRRQAWDETHKND